MDEKEYKKANLLNLQASTIPAWANMFNHDDENDNKKANILNLQTSTAPAWANMFSNDEDDEESSPKLKRDSP